MDKFRITVARMEVTDRTDTDAQVCVTFRVDGKIAHFQIPIFLRAADFDDTEMVQAARSILHQTLVELAAESQKWKLTPQDLSQLSRMSARPKASAH